ncbi:MAG: leucine--tRNA ligase [Methanocellales archaeon]|nr:leucine--tRNA ligase [Methanocellales archaeon]MDD5446827.1 leucine--tRNA ligase [Methanocellales archaeon]
MNRQSFANRHIEEKWQSYWAKSRIFEAEIDTSKKKFFVNFPYPYMNGYFHLGHTFSLMRVEVFARYKRMQGYNVLFPFAFHCTGTPIIAAAQRIAENEKAQTDILKQMGITTEEVPNFSDPIYWTSFFPKETMQDLKNLGASIDWRRSFITTSLNPHYDAFIKWQFRKLREGGYVVKGEHPVVWCRKCSSPVGDHARLEGEGTTPEETYLIKFDFNGKVLPTATYRPETSFGVTNLWVNPDAGYVEAGVDNERWIISEDMVEKLRAQKHVVNIFRHLKGESMVGERCTNKVTGGQVPILPAIFVKSGTGTGIVMSVPSHAPYDYAALKEVQENPRKYGVTSTLVKDIEPISLIKVPGYGAHPAIEIVEKMGIASQEDQRLEGATKEIYKKEFHTGILNENTGNYVGLKVFEAKEKIVSDFIGENKAALFYDLSEEVICRCLTKCIVKIVSDQWFLRYSDENWKKRTHEAMDNMTLYPDKVRRQFDYVIDWLKDWACTREFGLGTTLPWDEKWVIESLSDSTIYMAYYTISHYLEDGRYGIGATDSFFDYVFLGVGNDEKVAKDAHISVELLRKMRAEFEYWYPFDFRNSGKDLVQNHLAFCLFNHVALFSKTYWPLGIGVNGFIQIDGFKMSKSKGNFYTLRQIHDMYGADVTRLTLMYGGEGLDDPNWDTEFAKSIGSKLEQWQDFALENYGKGRTDLKYIDRWFSSVTNRAIKATLEMMDTTEFRTALQRGYFDLQRYLRWYLRRAGQNRELMDWFILTQTKILTPFVPHICEEIWEKLGKEGFISLAGYPTYDEDKIDDEIERGEEFVKGIIDDIKEILSIAKIRDSSTAYIYTAEDWKWKVLDIVGDKNLGDAMKEVMQEENLRKRGKEVSEFVKRIFSDRISVQRMNEGVILRDAKDFIEGEVGLTVKIDADYDPQNKRRLSIPGRPSIYIA